MNYYFIYHLSSYDDDLNGTDVHKIFDSLKSHLHRKNLVPESTCQCGAFEVSYHSCSSAQGVNKC